ncbi:cytosolic sulfotransferase 2-like [Seriola lalandi dorsalis]|uniref:cytosolic sulfotransferase 2-like n=1 Tax=Seriola lalandi dorsalis TaxID=1841481 RepID=UPI000C6F74CE|nr:cytosolic sulfotransferase 2-like [Seriola lalandi dorsalis]
MELPLRPKLFDFHGVSMTKYFTDNWYNIQNFKARPDDILTATYPKAARCRLNVKTQSHSITECLSWRYTFLEPSQARVDELYMLTTFPRIIKTHLPVQVIPKSFSEQNSKIIYMARNAKENALFYFHLNRMNMVQLEPGDRSSFLQRFMEGKRESRMRAYQKKQTTSNILYLFYEDLIEVSLKVSLWDCKTQAQDFTLLLLNENSTVCAPAWDCLPLIAASIYTGKVGDWKNYFAAQQSEQFDEGYKKKMKNRDLQFRRVL